MLGNTIFCREITKADLPTVLHLYGQPDSDDDNVLTLNVAKQIYALMVSYPDYKIYVAIHTVSIVGTFALLSMNNLGHMTTTSAILENVTVGPAW